jgi:exopolysaccharide/PEP-CTERM locus tyrosine autokinase
MQPEPVRRPPPDPNRIVKVDREALRTSGLLPPPAQERELADQYRAIKRPLIQAAFHSPPEEGSSAQLVMIASALPGDGKTFTSVNLAFSIAREKDHSVLLVDADVAKPHVSKLFGIEKEPGLLDLLTNPELDVESVIVPTDVPGLSLLPSGTPSDAATELLASERMGQVIRQLAAREPSGMVLFDSLPVLLTSESRALAAHMGQIVLVVKAGGTPQHAVSDAVEAIGPERKVWLVLNQAELSGAVGYYYGYPYGYRPKLVPQAQDGAGEKQAEKQQAAGF